jgi:hypothetical protein
MDIFRQVRKLAMEDMEKLVVQVFFALYVRGDETDSAVVDPDQSWNADTAEVIAAVLDRYGLRPMSCTAVLAKAESPATGMERARPRDISPPSPLCRPPHKEKQRVRKKELTARFRRDRLRLASAVRFVGTLRKRSAPAGCIRCRALRADLFLYWFSSLFGLTSLFSYSLCGTSPQFFHDTLGQAVPGDRARKRTIAGRPERTYSKPIRTLLSKEHGFCRVA